MILWCVDMFVMSFGLYDLPKTSNEANSLLLFGNSMFVIGFLSKRINPKSKYELSSTTLSQQVNHLLKNKILLLSLLVLTVYVLSLFAQFYTMVVFYQSLGDIRSEYYENDIYGYAYTILNPYVINPLKVILPFILGYMLMNKTLIRKNIFAFVLILIFLFFSSSLSGSRFSYVKILLPIFFVTYLTKPKINVRKVILLGTFLYFFFIFISFITSARSGDFNNNDTDESIKAIASYTFAPIAAFDYSLQHDYVEVIGGHGFGTLTFAAVENLFYSVVSKIGITYSRPIGAVAETTQSYIRLSPSITWNALYTWFLYFYLDFGIIGILFFPFLFGRIFRQLLSMIYKYNCIEFTILASNFFMIVVFSVFMWGLSSAGAFLTYMILFYLGLRKTRSHY